MINLFIFWALAIVFILIAQSKAYKKDSFMQGVCIVAFCLFQGLAIYNVIEWRADTNNAIETEKLRNESLQWQIRTMERPPVQRYYQWLDSSSGVLRWEVLLGDDYEIRR